MMRANRVALVLLAFVSVAVAATARLHHRAAEADPASAILRLFSAKTDSLVVIRPQQLRKSALLQKHVRTLRAMTRDMPAACDDVLSRVDTFVIGRRALENATSMIIHGRVLGDVADTCLGAVASDLDLKFDRQTYQDHTVYVSEKSNAPSIAFIDNTTVILGDIADVKRTIDALTDVHAATLADNDYFRQVWKQQLQRGMWAAATFSAEEGKTIMSSLLPGAASITSFVASLDLTDRAALQMASDTESEKSAAELSTAVRAKLAALSATFGTSDPGVADLLARGMVSARANHVGYEITLEPDAVKLLVAKVSEGLGAKTPL
jgi:hypothetical protein